MLTLEQPKVGPRQFVGCVRPSVESAVTFALLPAASHDSLDLDPWVWWVTMGSLPPSSPSTSCGSPATRTASNRETGLALGGYIGAAIVFGLGMWYSPGPARGRVLRRLADRDSLSVDNLFIFLLIMAKFAVPEMLQPLVLLVGIILAIVLRGLFIWLGAAAIEKFSWVFYIFGAFLIYTAWSSSARARATTTSTRRTAS